mgnify:CR=1 FL=1
MQSLTSTFTLENGVKIPVVGFGTWQTPDGDTAVNSVMWALRAGYRHIDTAAIYGNERSVGAAIKASRVPREELFVTSKLWNANRGYETTLKAFEQTMADLGLEYLDLYLIHWPANAKQFPNGRADELNLATWQAMTELYKAGRIKAIGVSNFLPHHLEPLMKTEVKPMVNQIEFHPGYMQAETVEYCRRHNILVEAWSPLGNGRLLADSALGEIAARYGRSTAQLVIRWVLQQGILPLPKSVTESRIIENAQVFDFEISAQDMATITAMPAMAFSGLNPDTADF